MCKNSTLPHLHYMYSFFPIKFLCLYIKNRIFYKFVLLVKVTQHRNAFLMLFVRWFFIFFCRAQTVHDNHLCSYWENLVHIYSIFQYSIILEMITCSSSVTLFVSWFHYSFVWSVCIIVDEKHFLSNLYVFHHVQKLQTQQKCTFHVIFYVICVSNLYFLYYCKQHRNAFLMLFVMLSFVLFGTAKTMHYIISVISDKIWFTYMLYANIRL